MFNSMPSINCYLNYKTKYLILILNLLQRKRNEHIMKLYRSLAVSLRHLQYVNSNEESPRTSDNISRHLQVLEQQLVGTLLCHLSTLSWKQGYTCEEEKRITEHFREKSEIRSRRYYRDFVLLQYVKKTLSYIEKSFSCLMGRQ